jgi:hypothetical protein
MRNLGYKLGRGTIRGILKAHGIDLPLSEAKGCRGRCS